MTSLTRITPYTKKSGRGIQKVMASRVTMVMHVFFYNRIAMSITT